ncbi:hypothetical protein ACPOL_1719 [Acidisarcina polymorpha]|uniref:Uncharacterized protein n=1 Tax=Acidisarcina polymorpha TaxID=2211140 RepID=A0A2Z5FW51_9BACT|nr:hypothetical protein ACPOL_1719 [Acidisarcina polymorpha]
MNPEPKKVVAHELAHIWLGINDEADAKKLTEFLVRGFPENAFVLEAGR